MGRTRACLTAKEEEWPISHQEDCTHQLRVVTIIDHGIDACMDFPASSVMIVVAVDPIDIILYIQWMAFPLSVRIRSGSLNTPALKSHHGDPDSAFPGRNDALTQTIKIRLIKGVF